MDNTPRVTRATMLDREPCGVYSLPEGAVGAAACVDEGGGSEEFLVVMTLDFVLAGIKLAN